MSRKLYMKELNMENTGTITTDNVISFVGKTVTLNTDKLDDSLFLYPLHISRNSIGDYFYTDSEGGTYPIDEYTEIPYTDVDRTQVERFEFRKDSSIRLRIRES